VSGAVVVVVVPPVDFVSVFDRLFVGGCSPCVAPGGILRGFVHPSLSLLVWTVVCCSVCSIEGVVFVLFVVFVGSAVGDSDPPRTSVVAGAECVPAVVDVVDVEIVAAVVVVAAVFVMRGCRWGKAAVEFG